jgi:hypothetical protein
LKYGYSKLTLIKVWVPYFKSDERSGVISEVLPNSQNTPPFLRKKKKTLQDLDVSQNLTKFAKTSMHVSLKNFILFFLKKIQGYFENFDRI